MASPLTLFEVMPLLILVLPGATAVTSLLNEIPEEKSVTNHDNRFGLFRLTDDFIYSANPEGLIQEDKLLVRRQLSADVIGKRARSAPVSWK